jgi:hypothetical protein
MNLAGTTNLKRRLQMKTKFNTSTLTLFAMALVMFVALGNSVQAQNKDTGGAGNTSQATAANEGLNEVSFSNASLRGRYAFLNVVTTLAASFGTFTFDGNGNAIAGSATGNTIIRNPAGLFDSLVFPFPFTGTYSLNPDGLGHVVFRATLPGGAIQVSTWDFVVIEARKDEGGIVATELRAIQRERDQNTASFGQAIVKRLGDN